MDHYGHPMKSVSSSMNNLSVSSGMGAHSHSNSSPNQVYYPTISTQPSGNEDFFPDFVKSTTVTTSTTSSSVPSSALNIIPAQSQQSSDSEVLAHIRNGMTRMMATMERLEQRINRVEQVTSQILKNQQESFQVPFMSQKEIDNARSLAEQLEQDTSVAKQLQAAYNKEMELRKYMPNPMLASDCPICGARVNQMELENHVDKCLDMFSNDPKKQAEVKETKQKMESGFFSKFFNKTKTETTTSTKVISSRSNSNAPLLTESENQQMQQQQSFYPYGYPQFAPMSMQNMQAMQNMQNMQNMQSNGGMPMMMPMYMYPGYPNQNE